MANEKGELGNRLHEANVKVEALAVLFMAAAGEDDHHHRRGIANFLNGIVEDLDEIADDFDPLMPQSAEA